MRDFLKFFSRRQVHGHIESVTPNQIRLSVTDYEHTTPCAITIALNNVPIQQVLVPNNQLKISEGAVQFSVVFPPGIAPKRGDLISAWFAGIKRPLAGSPWHIDVRNEPLEFVVLHIPKTAGTSLRMAIEKSLGEESIFPSSEYLRRKGGKYPNAYDLSCALKGVGSDVRLVQGHFSVKDIETFAPEAKRITILRDPLARVISLLQHLKHRNNQAESFDEMMAPGGRAIVATKNHQTRLLSGLPQDAADEEHFEAAKEHLHTFAVVGITERYAETLLLCEQTLGVRLGKPTRLNVSPAKKDTPPDRLTSQLVDMNRYDQKLYDYAASLMSARLSDLQRL